MLYKSVKLAMTLAIPLAGAEASALASSPLAGMWQCHSQQGQGNEECNGTEFQFGDDLGYAVSTGPGCILSSLEHTGKLSILGDAGDINFSSVQGETGGGELLFHSADQIELRFFEISDLTFIAPLQLACDRKISEGDQ